MQVAGDERFLLGAGPVFELGFALAGLGERRTGLEPEESDRRVQGGGPASATGSVVVQPLFQIEGGSNVKDTGLESEKVDHRGAPGKGGDEAEGCGEKGCMDDGRSVNGAVR